MPASANHQKILFSWSHSATEFTLSSLNFASCKQKAARKEIFINTYWCSSCSVATNLYSNKRFHSLLTCCIWSAHWRWLALYSLTIQTVTPLQHLQFSSSHSPWVYSGKKQTLLFRKHLLSLHNIFLLPYISSNLF